MTIDFAKIAQLPKDQRLQEALCLMNSGQIDVPTAQALMRGEVPLGRASVQVGTMGYGGCSSHQAQHRKNVSSAVYGAAMTRDLAIPESNRKAAKAAKAQIDGLIDAVQQGGPDQRQAINALRDFLGTLGPDVVAAIDARVGTLLNGLGQVGLSYVNAKLQEAGVVFEQVMDVWSEYFVKMAQPGDLRGTVGRISFDFQPYSEETKAYFRSKGRDDQGKWSVQFEGMEAHWFRADPTDGSISAKQRQLTRGVTGSLEEIMPTFIALMGEQALPSGYAFEIDLDKVPQEQHAAVRAQLEGLKDYGAELKYRVSDAAELLALRRESGQIEVRISELLKTAQEAWTPAQRQEYESVYAAYHNLPAKHYEQ